MGARGRGRVGLNMDPFSHEMRMYYSLYKVTFSFLFFFSSLRVVFGVADYAHDTLLHIPLRPK